MGEKWTDERLDDFRGEVNRRFDEAAADVNRRFDKVDGALAGLDSRLNGLDSRMDGFQRTLLLLCGGIITALIGVLGTAIYAVAQM